MFSGLSGWHLIIILAFAAPLLVAAIGIPVSVAQGRARRDAGLVTHPEVNTLAVIAFVASFFVGIVGVVCGHLARVQIRDNGQAGWGFATFALFLGYTTTVLGFFFLVMTALNNLGAL